MVLKAFLVGFHHFPHSFLRTVCSSHGFNVTLPGRSPCCHPFLSILPLLILFQFLKNGSLLFRLMFPPSDFKSAKGDFFASLRFYHPESCSLAQAGLKLKIPLPQLPKSWNYSCITPCLVCFNFSGVCLCSILFWSWRCGSVGGALSVPALRPVFRSVTM